MSDEQFPVDYNRILLTIHNNGTAFPTRFPLGQIMSQIESGETRGNIKDNAGRNAGHWKLRDENDVERDRAAVAELDRLYISYIKLLWRTEREWFDDMYINLTATLEEDVHQKKPLASEEEVEEFAVRDVVHGPRFYTFRDDFEHYLNYKGNPPKRLRNLLELTTENLL